MALALALESHGVGLDAFKLPTGRLARLGFLPGWTRQNYRTALANAIATGLIERVEPATLGRHGASYRLSRLNGLASNPAPAARRRAV